MNDGGPAFPCVIHYTYEQDVEITDPAAAAYGMVVKQTKHADTEHSGMSLRDWFAGMALQGMLANGFQPGMLPESHNGNTADFDYTRAAFKLADYMLAERQKQK